MVDYHKDGNQTIIFLWDQNVASVICYTTNAGDHCVPRWQLVLQLISFKCSTSDYWGGCSWIPATWIPATDFYITVTYAMASQENQYIVTTNAGK